MTPDQLLTQLKRGQVASAYLFIGPDVYRRAQVRAALRTAVLGSEQDENGFTRHDLDEVELAEVMDDASSYSLFASRRLLWVGAAEGALPRILKAATSEDSGSGADRVRHFLLDPIPDVCVVFDVTRYEMDGEDKAKLERVRKFYAPVRDVVEFPPFTPAEARTLMGQLAQKLGIKLAPGAGDYLLEATGANANRLSNELDKLSLLVGTGGTVSEDMIAKMVPDARETTIFALVAAMGRKDRIQSLELLDTSANRNCVAKKLKANGRYSPSRTSVSSNSKD